MNQETAQTKENSTPDTPETHTPAEPAKKGPGRPKGTNAKKAAANGNSAEAKKSAGRPKKSATKAASDAGETPKKSAGRPKSTANGANSGGKKNRADNGSASSDRDNGNQSNGPDRGSAGFGQSSEYAQGFQDFGTGFMTFAQSHMEKSVQAAQQLLNCRSIEDMAQVQSQFLQESFDSVVREANKMAQNAANFAKKTAAPLNTQMEELMQKFKRAAQ